MKWGTGYFRLVYNDFAFLGNSRKHWASECEVSGFLLQSVERECTSRGWLRSKVGWVIPSPWEYLLAFCCVMRGCLVWLFSFFFFFNVYVKWEKKNEVVLRLFFFDLILENMVMLQFLWSANTCNILKGSKVFFCSYIFLIFCLA